jgi:hypothetical protein
MEPSLSSLPSDIIRVVLSYLKTCPFTLGILGRVCKDLHTKTDALLDVWESLASCTPEVGDVHHSSSAAESKLAFCKAKLNRFQSLVKRIRRGEGNVTKLHECGPPYVPAAKTPKKQPKPETRDAEHIHNNDEDGEENEEDDGSSDSPDEGYFDDADVVYLHQVVYNAGASDFILSVVEEESGSSWSTRRVVKVKRFSAQAPTKVLGLLPKRLFDPLEEGDVISVANRFFWFQEFGDRANVPFEFYDCNTQQDELVDLSAATSIPNAILRIFPNRLASHPWILILCQNGGRADTDDDEDFDEGEDSAGPGDEEPQYAIAIYDIDKRQFVLRDHRVQLSPDNGSPFDGKYDASAAFSFIGDYFATAECSDYEKQTRFFKIERTESGATIVELWQREGELRITSLNGSAATVVKDNNAIIVDANTGHVLVELERRWPVSGYEFIGKSSCGRLVTHGDMVWDVFDGSTPVITLGHTSVTFLDATRWVLDARHACYAVDFSSPYVQVNASITCCAIGTLEQKGDHVDGTASIVEIPCSNILSSIAKLLGCSENNLVARRFFQWYRGYAVRRGSLVSHTATPILFTVFFYLQLY